MSASQTYNISKKGKSIQGLAGAVGEIQDSHGLLVLGKALYGLTDVYIYDVFVSVRQCIIT